MPIDLQRLLALDIPETQASYGPRDAILYALGIGIGLDPRDPGARAFVTGDAPRIVPTFAMVLGYESFWIETEPTGIDVRRVLHASQGLRLHRPLAANGAIRRKIRVAGITDKGERGVLLSVEERIRDAMTDAPIADLTSTILCRGEGGCGSAGVAAPLLPPIPDRAPDAVRAIAASPQQALIYRLSGDRNPLHDDPAAARAAGFDRPILHGLASYGMACKALLAEMCADDPARFGSLDARFAGVVFPGEPLELRLWRDGPGRCLFRIVVPGRGDAPALDNGVFAFAA